MFAVSFKLVRPRCNAHDDGLSDALQRI